MGKKIVLASVVGSIVVFVVSFIWHMVPSLGEMGVRAVPAEDTVLAALRTWVHEPGFYVFPAPDTTPGRSKDEVKAAQTAFLERYRRGPTGVLVYKPGGEPLSFGRLLGVQFLLGLVASVVAAWALALAAPATTYGGRVLLVLLLALFGGLVYDLPAWLWYGFPTSYVAGHIASWLLSWGAAGLAMAPIFPPARP